MASQDRWQAARAQTPMLAQRCFLNHAGSSPMSAATGAAVRAHLDREQAIGGYAAADEALPARTAARASVAALFEGDPGEVALVGSATEAWQLALDAFDLGPGARVLVGPWAYGSNAIGLIHHASRQGWHLQRLPADGAGLIDLEATARALPGAALLCLTHVPTSNGVVQPAGDVGALCAAHGVPYLLDACQSVGQMPVPASAWGATAVCATGRKYVRGPRGTGMLWASAAWLDRGAMPRHLDLTGGRWLAGDQVAAVESAVRFERYEHAVAGVLGLGVAADEALALGLSQIAERVRSLAADLREALAAVPGVRVLDRGLAERPETRCGLVTFVVADHAPDALAAQLRAACVDVSVTHLGSSRWDLQPRGLEAVLRASVHAVNTHADVQCMVRTLTELVRG